MNKHLILIRHAAPEIDSSIPSSQWKLNEAGKRSADLLAKQLSTFPIEAVVSSHEPKAWETARILASSFNLSPEIHSRLHEHDRAQVPFISEADFTQTMVHLFANPDKLTFGSETANEASRRFEKAVFELLVRHSEDELAIVSHGTVLALFIAKQLNEDPYEIWKNLSMPEAFIFSRPELLLTSTIKPGES